MDEIILRSLSGETTDEEEQALAEWRRSSDANEAQHRRLVRLVQIAGLVKPSLRRAAPPDVTDLLQRLDDRVISPPAGRGPRLAPWILFAAAAAALVVLAVSTRKPDNRPQPAGLGNMELVTGAGETVTATLGDGSVVRLAPGSRLRVANAKDDREVWLQGRAYFAVTKQDGRPFRVLTDAGQATVLGTRFDIRSESGDLQLVVIEGRVEVSAAGTKVKVGPNEIGRVVGRGIPRVERVKDVQAMLGWMDGFFVFESTPLRDALAELGRRHGIRIDLRDSLLGERTVGGWSANQGPAETLTAICRTVGARCALRAGVAVVEP